MRSPESIRALWLLGLASAAVLFAQTWTRAHRPGGIDLTTYLEAARAVAHGANPYTLNVPFPYLYPAFLAFALVPATLLPDSAILVFWFMVSIWALVWTMREVLQSAYPELRGRSLTPFLAALFVISFPIIQNNLRNGQVNFIVLLLCAYALKTTLSGGNTRGAMAWGAAIAIKIVPAVLAPFFIRRRRWRAVTAGTVMAAALFAVPAIAAGRAILAYQWQHAAALMSGTLEAGDATEPLQFSAGAMLAWLPLAISPGWVRVAGSLVVLGALAAADSRRPADRFGDTVAFVLYLAAIPLISPKSEVHHLAFALPAAAIVWAHRWHGFGPRLGASTWLGYAAVLCYAVAFTVRPLASVAYFLALITLAGATAALPHTGVNTS